MKTNFSTDRIFAAGLSYKEKSGEICISTRKTMIRIITFLLLSAAIWVSITLPPHFSENHDFWWTIPTLWIVALSCLFLYALPHSKICYNQTSDYLMLHKSLPKSPQKILFSEIKSIDRICFTQESPKSITNTLSESITDYVLDLTLNVLPITLIRPQATFKEDVYAICFTLKHGERIFTHFTWDIISADRTVTLLKEKIW